MVGEHTERLAAFPGCEDFAWFRAVGRGAVGVRDGRRLPYRCGSGDERYPTSSTTLWSSIHESLYCVISQIFSLFLCGASISLLHRLSWSKCLIHSLYCSALHCSGKRCMLKINKTYYSINIYLREMVRNSKQRTRPPNHLEVEVCVEA